MPPFSQIHRVKLPVSDLAASRTGTNGSSGSRSRSSSSRMTNSAEWPSPTATARSAGSATEPERAAALSGFGLVALAVPTRDDVEAWVRHLDTARALHGGVATGHRGGVVLVGLRDPDGIEIRLYAD